jgi:hypothetical protein
MDTSADVDNNLSIEVVPSDTTIDSTNMTDTSNGYTITAYNADGSVGTLSEVSGTTHDGFGVAGSASGADVELGYDSSTGESEKIELSFDNDVSEVSVSFAWLATNETAKVEFYLDGELVDSQNIEGKTDAVDDSVTLLSTESGIAFDTVVFSGAGVGDDDYLINNITFTEVNASDDVINASESTSLSTTLSGIDSDAVSVIVTFTDESGATITPIVADYDVDTETWSVADADISTLANGTIISTVTVIDDAGNIATANDILELDTTTNNEVPIAIDDLPTLTTDEDSAITVDVLANDTDADGDTLSISAIQGQDVSNGEVVNVTSTDGTNTILGTASVVDEKIVFTPDEILQSMDDGENQNVTFEYTISDSNGGIDTASVTVNVTGVDDGITETMSDINSESVTTGSGDDTITMGSGKNQEANSGDGDDTITMGSGKNQEANSGDGDDTITMGSGKNQEANAGDGDDTITVNGDGFVANGDSGDDTFNISSDDISRSSLNGTIDGGEGFDTLLYSDDMEIDFSALSDDVSSIEAIELGEGSQTLTSITLEDVLDITDEIDGANVLRIEGDSSDHVELNNAQWESGDSITIDSETYQEYTSVEDSTVTLEISTEIIVDPS